MAVRFVKSKEDRKRPSVYMQLKTEEWFKGYALFEPDPEAENNPGFLEYYNHYDNQGNAYVPCSGDKCPFCAANLNPATRALTVWYFPDNPKGQQLKVFTANYGTINGLADESEDEDGIFGKMLRIKRLSDKGEYRVKTLGEKPLTKTEIKGLLKEVEGLDLEGTVERQLKVQMERLKALDALEDDDDDEDEEPTTKGRAISEEEDDDEDDDEEEESDEDDDEEEESSEEDDDEEDEEAEEEEETDDDEDEEDEEEEEEPSEMTGSFEVVKFNEADETIDFKDEDGKKVKMWLGEGVEWDADEIIKGSNATVSALQDDEGDWVITDIKVKKARAPRKPAAKPAAKPKAKAPAKPATRTRRTTKK